MASNMLEELLFQVNVPCHIQSDFGSHGSFLEHGQYQTWKPFFNISWICGWFSIQFSLSTFGKHKLQNGLEDFDDYFDNQRLVLAIFNLKSLQGESASELRKRIVAFDGNLASMQGLKVDKFSSDFVWSRILTNKLDSNSRRQLGVHHP